MKAEQVVELIKTLEPTEIERLFSLIKEYETKVRRRQASVRYGRVDEDFEKIADQVLKENQNLFKEIAKFERKELERSDERAKP